MYKFLPIFQSKKLESQYCSIQNQQIRIFFLFLTIVEIINYIYAFSKLINEGVVNARLLSSYITIALTYIIILCLIIRKHNLGIYLMPLLACLKPFFRWISNKENLTMNKSSDYFIGIINIMEFFAHLQSSNYFYKIFCVVCYVSQDIALNISLSSDRVIYLALASVFFIFLVNSYMTDRKQRQMFLDNQKLFMWHQLIDKQSKTNFFVAKYSNNNEKTKFLEEKSSIQMYFINKQASQSFQCNTQEKFNAFLDRIIIQEEEDMIDDFFKSRSISEKTSSNIFLNRHKSISNKKTLLYVCQQLIQQKQKQAYEQFNSVISPAQELLGIIIPEKQNQTQNQIPQEVIQQQNNGQQSSQPVDFKSQIVQIKLFYYNLLDEYIIIQIDEEDYKIKAKKQKEEQKLALSFRDNLTYYMKEQLEFIIQSLKVDFEKFKKLESYKVIMNNLYRMKQNQSNIIVALTDISNLVPYEAQQINLKSLITSLLNLFSININNQASFSPEILNFKLKNENIQSSQYWLNHILFNLMQNCKQHGLKDGQIQVKIQQDELDDNLINIDIINQLSQSNLEKQLNQIKEMTNIQTSEDLFKHFYQKQIAIYSKISQNLLKRQFKNNSVFSPSANPKDMLKSQLRYTLGIYVSRLSLKRIGPNGLINYSISDFQNKQSLVASFQIYKDIALLHEQEKENFTQLFGRNSILVNKDLQQAFTSCIIQQFATNNNINISKNEQSNLLPSQESKKQDFNQQKIQDYIQYISRENQLNNNLKLNRNKSDIKEEDEGEEDKDQIDNAFVQNKVEDEEEINPLNQQYNNSTSINVIQSQANMRVSLFQNKNKSLFFRDVIQSEKIIEKTNEDGFILNSDEQSNKNSLTQSGLIGEYNDNSEIQRSQVKEQQNYKFKLNKNTSILDTIADEQIDQAAISKLGSQLITNRESILMKNQNGRLTYRTNAVEICQVENQINLHTPTIVQEKQPFILDEGEISLLQKDY